MVTLRCQGQQVGLWYSQISAMKEPYVELLEVALGNKPAWQACDTDERANVEMDVSSFGVHRTFY